MREIVVVREFMDSDLWVYVLASSEEAGVAKENEKMCEIMLPGLNSGVICHFSPFKYDDTIIVDSYKLRYIFTDESVRGD